MIKVDGPLSQKLLALGVSHLHQGAFNLPEDCVFEPPCSLKWMGVQYSLAMGAFSYAVSGYYFGTSIGRYTSIGESVQVGRGSHPTNWLSTSPVFYFRHQDVTDFTIPEAANFVRNAPSIKAAKTIIGNDVYIGHGAFVLQGITIGDGAIVGACAVVTRDVPPYAVVAGSPAVIKKMRMSDALIERMHRVKWWRYAFWDFSNMPASEPERFLDILEEKVASGLAPFTPKTIALKDVVAEK